MPIAPQPEEILLAPLNQIEISSLAASWAGLSKYLMLLLFGFT